MSVIKPLYGVVRKSRRSSVTALRKLLDGLRKKDDAASHAGAHKLGMPLKL